MDEERGERAVPAERDDAPRVTAAESLDPAAAFALLGNELRVDILLELGDATDGTKVHGLSFADLRERCGVRDSGRFNYHLQELVGTFVYEEDGAYRLRYPGVLLYEAIQAGSLTDRLTVEPFGVGRDCRDCGTELQGSYRDSLFEVACPDCGRREMKYTLPPGAVREGDADQVVRAAQVYGRRDVMAVAQGVCPVCAGPVAHEIVPEGEGESDLERSINGPAVVHGCDGCSKFFTTSVALPLVYEPAVVAFFHEHGTDVLSAPPWELGFRDEDVATVVQRDPTRAAVAFEADGETLRVTVDEGLDVVDTARD